MRLVLGGFLAFAVLACGRTSGDTYLTSRSPTGHQLRLLGDLISLQRGLIVNVVEAQSVSALPSSRVEIHRTSRYDLPFREKYPKEEWVDGDVLRFISHYGQPLSRRARLINDGKETVSLVAVSVADLFVAVDLKPGETRVVRVPVTRWCGADAVFGKGSTKAGSSLILSDTASEDVVIRMRDGSVEILQNRLQ
jgi:hypothetical protein